MTALGVCLDDVGLHPGVNEAALALSEQGAISAMSAMVGAPAWSQAVSALRSLDPQQVDIGLHLDLTAFPLSQPAHPLSWWMARTLSHTLGPGQREALTQECVAQLQGFIRDLGRWPSHIDGHQHVHVFPLVRDALRRALLQVAASHPGLPSVLWLRGTARTPGVPFPVKTRIIEAMGHRALAQALPAWQAELLTVQPLWRGRLQLSPRLLGVYDFNATPGCFSKHLGAWCRLARPDDVLMVHASTQAIAHDGIQAARLAEWQFLSSPHWVDLRDRHDLRLKPPSQA